MPSDRYDRRQRRCEREIPDASGERDDRADLLPNSGVPAINAVVAAVDAAKEDAITGPNASARTNPPECSRSATVLSRRPSTRSTMTRPDWVAAAS